MSFYDGEMPENLVISQPGSDLLVRVRKSQQVGVNAGLRPGIRRFVVITPGLAGTVIYVDGVLSGTYPKLILHPETLRGRLILGNGPQGRLDSFIDPNPRTSA
jgi:hypothetical protein